MSVSIPELFEVVALILGLIVLIQSKLENLLAWAVCLVCLALLWGSFVHG